MPELKTFFIESNQNINLKKINGNSLKKHFNIPTNSLVAFINSENLDTLCFILESKNNQNSIKLLSKLFLLSINKVYPELFDINGFCLSLNSIPLSTHLIYKTTHKSLFIYSIVLRTNKKTKLVAHSNIIPKDFSISVLNEFKTHYDDSLN